MNLVTDILFDFDDTLSPGPTSGYIPMDELKEKFGLTEEQGQKLLDLDFEYLKKYYLPEVSSHIKTFEDEEILHRHVFGLMADGIGIADDEAFIDLMVDFRMKKLQFAIYPEVPAVLRELSHSYTLHVFTNALPSRFREVTDTPVGKYFKNIFVSNPLGMFKPQPEYYQYALEQLGKRPEQVMLVDDKEEFLVPAKELGMKTVLMDRKKKFPESKFKRIESLAGLM